MLNPGVFVEVEVFALSAAEFKVKALYWLIVSIHTLLSRIPSLHIACRTVCVAAAVQIARVRGKVAGARIIVGVGDVSHRSRFIR